MKKLMLSAILVAAFSGMVSAQDLKEKDVPATVKAAFVKKYPESKTFKVSWEKEKGNYEANWGVNQEKIILLCSHLLPVL